MNVRIIHVLVRLGVLAALANIAVTDAVAATHSVSTISQLEATLASASSGDTIQLAPGVYTMPSSSTLRILRDVTIEGDASTPSIIDGAGNTIFRVTARNVSLRNLTLRNGRTGISWGNSGSFSITGVTITGITGAGFASDDSGTVAIVNSTFAYNINTRGFGEPARAVHVDTGSAVLINVTVAGNDRGLIFGDTDGTFVVRNSLIVSNTQDCEPRFGAVFSGVNSFDSDGSCGFATVADTGIGRRPLDINDDDYCQANDPRSGCSCEAPWCPIFMGPEPGRDLTDNGGPTQTLALPANSPAVGAGSAAECAATTDQRGAARDDGLCDLGAFERARTISILAPTPSQDVVHFTTSVGTFSRFRPVSEASMPNQAGKPAGVTFPFGFFGWSIELPQPGLWAKVTMLFPTPVSTPPQYWKVIGGLWTDVCRPATCAASGNILTLDILDGGVDDLDGIANGVIVDPGGLGEGGESADATPPTTLATLSGTAGNNGWFRSAVEIILTCADEDSGSGCASIEYSIDGAPFAVYTGPFLVSGDGPHVVAYRSTDAASNVEATNSESLKIDATPPVVVCAATPDLLSPPNHKLVAVSFGIAIEDALSGSAGFSLVSFASSEPDNGSGDGDTANDIQGFTLGSTDTTGYLRAERAGKGTGRRYTFGYIGADQAGNTAECLAVVSVSHGQRNR